MLLKVKGGLEAWVTAGSSALYTATEGWAYICNVKVGNPLQGLFSSVFVFQTLFVAGYILHHAKVITPSTCHLPRGRRKAVVLLIPVDRKAEVSLHRGLSPGIGEGKDGVCIEFKVD